MRRPSLAPVLLPCPFPFTLALIFAGCAARAAVTTTAKAAPAAAFATARPAIEVGEIAGAPFRIDIPPRWNGGLVMYCHGYRGAPVRFDAHEPNEMAQAFGPLGFAVAQSGYSAGGYAVREAAKDTEALRLYFTSKFGAPNETWLTGTSLGGSVTMMVLEAQPTTYEGGLSLSAPLGPMLSYSKILLFDQLVLFELLFPGHLPSPAAVPKDFMTTLERTDQIEHALDENPRAAERLRRFARAHTNHELAANLDLFTFILGELRKRWGGNPFDNRDTIYSGTGDDVAVNDGVRRYAADEGARALAIRDYTPTGRLERPLLAIRAVYDPMIVGYASDRYAEISQLAGRGDHFAQQYVRRDGHGEFLPAEIRSAFEELRRWRKTGERPKPGGVP